MARPFLSTQVLTGTAEYSSTVYRTCAASTPLHPLLCMHPRRARISLFYPTNFHAVTLCGLLGIHVRPVCASRLCLDVRARELHANGRCCFRADHPEQGRWPWRNRIPPRQAAHCQGEICDHTERGRWPQPQRSTSRKGQPTRFVHGHSHQPRMCLNT